MLQWPLLYILILFLSTQRLIRLTITDLLTITDSSRRHRSQTILETWTVETLKSCRISDSSQYLIQSNYKRLWGNFYGNAVACRRIAIHTHTHHTAPHTHTGSPNNPLGSITTQSVVCFTPLSSIFIADVLLEERRPWRKRRPIVTGAGLSAKGLGTWKYRQVSADIFRCNLQIKADWKTWSGFRIGSDGCVGLHNDTGSVGFSSCVSDLALCVVVLLFGDISFFWLGCMYSVRVLLGFNYLSSLNPFCAMKG